MYQITREEVTFWVTLVEVKNLVLEQGAKGSSLVNAKELEFGFVLKEFLRLSFGVGNRDFNQSEQHGFLQNYYSSTAGLVFNFKNRISLETYITHIFDNDFNIQSARLKSMLALRFYIYQKAYKVDRKNTKQKY